MSFSYKFLLPLLGTALLGLAAPGIASAQETVSTPARLDHIEAEVDGLTSKLHLAQGYGYGRPPGNIGGGDDSYNSPPPQDAAGLDVRIGHLEEQIRQINGQIEQMQFSEHRLEEQLKKFQQDIDFRFQEPSHGGAKQQKRTDATDSDISMPPVSNPPASNPMTTGSAGMDVSPQSAPLRTGRRGGDAFDPAADPNAPGVPRQLGSISSTATALPPPVAPRTVANNAPSSIIADDESDQNAPLDLSSGRRNSQPSAGSANTPPGLGTAAAPRQIPLTPQPSPSATPSTQVAAVPPVASPKDEFEAALGYYKQKEYENAEKSFSTFLQKNPKNRMAADAIYFLGETYFQRGRAREAAEQYLKISTDYSTSAHAPEAMLHLGQSLNQLGAKEQACATFSEVTRKYPNAQAWVKTGAEREASHAKC